MKFTPPAMEEIPLTFIPFFLLFWPWKPPSSPGISNSLTVEEYGDFLELHIGQKASFLVQMLPVVYYLSP